MHTKSHKLIRAAYGKMALYGRIDPEKKLQVELGAEMIRQHLEKGNARWMYLEPGSHRHTSLCNFLKRVAKEDQDENVYDPKHQLTDVGSEVTFGAVDGTKDPEDIDSDENLAADAGTKNSYLGTKN